MLILWSGGCDSTYLLYDNLSKGNEEITTLSIMHNQVVCHEKERYARENITKELYHRGYKFNSIELQVVGSQVKTSGCPQAAIWLSLAVPHLEIDESLAVGYIRHDDLFHHKHSYQQIFKYYCKLLEKGNSTLLFPLEWMEKSTITSHLKKIDLLEHCWYCETPRKNGRRCGICVSCKKHATS